MGKKTTNLDTWRMMSKCGDARGTNKHGDDYEPRMVTLDTLQWSSCQISETSDLSGVILRNFKSIRPPKRPPKKQEQRVATPWRWRLNKPKFKKKRGEGLDGGSWSFSKYLKSSHIRLSECIPNKTSTFVLLKFQALLIKYEKSSPFLSMFAVEKLYIYVCACMC